VPKNRDAVAQPLSDGRVVRAASFPIPAWDSADTRR
jgi:hypothetical protein